MEEIKYNEEKNNWYFRIDVGRDPKTKKRRQVFRSFKTKKEAKVACAKIRTQVEEGTYFEPSIEMFKDYIQRWFTSIYKPSVSLTTSESRWYIIKNHLIPYFKNMNLKEIDTFSIDCLYDEKREEGLQPSYIKIMHHLLNSAFKKAVKWSLLRQNPVEGATPPTIKRKKKKAPWTKDELKQFLEFVLDTEVSAPYVLASFTGARRGEVLGLRWKDINFDNQTIHIQQSLTRTKEKGLIFTDLKNNSSDREIVVSPFVIEVLRLHQEKQNKLKKKLGNEYQDFDLVTCAVNGKPIDPRNLLRQYYSLIDKALVPKITFHDLRHLHATMLLHMKVHAKVVADRLGHSRIQVTLDTYSHGSDELQRETAIQFENELFGS
ncbi:site-specific integrase [Sutcliffiella cohnii]|uniref:site-specific integrase n=1 Tax=Sutcliffiella cohnii TaxID=33932 RepID=UPI002E23F664|nr:site-specific integrase [Sutcliffiella cohnii]